MIRMHAIMMAPLNQHLQSQAVPRGINHTLSRFHLGISSRNFIWGGGGGGKLTYHVAIRPRRGEGVGGLLREA